MQHVARDAAGATAPARGIDLLRVPGLGRLLRMRRVRLAFQIPLALLALVLVLHGLFGPELAPKNLSTLLVWVHWRGALVIALLVLGNVFCFGCPLLLPREMARRFFSPSKPLPLRLRRKWLGLGLFVAVLFLYEWLDLWASPAATAWMILAYFGVAFAVDMLFAGAPFCKWICPIGQFNFVASTMSPLEVRARDLATCDACATKDCIKGRPAVAAVKARVDRAPKLRGCELALFVPQKTGNLDCTLCLDCVHACPADNIALATRVPGDELVADPIRSGIGRLSRRPDIAAFIVVFTFGALLNAFGMVGPVYTLQRRISELLGTESDFVVLAVLFTLGLVVVPIACLAAVTYAVHLRTRAPIVEHGLRFAPSLVPLGFGVWLAHYSFHFLTGLWTFVPVTQHALRDMGIELLGRPRWGLGGLHESTVWPIEIGFLGLGLAGSLAVAWRLAARDFPRARAAAFAPWAVLYVALSGAALWLLAQPMEMRGTFL